MGSTNTPTSDSASATIQVRKQVRLSAAKCVELVLSGLRFRLFRASVTVTIIALAMAFLMTMLSEALVTRRVAAVVHERTAPRRTFLFWLDRVSAPLSEALLVREAGTMAPGDARWSEVAAWGELTDPDMARLTTTCSNALPILAFFSDLSDSELRPLVGRNRGLTIFPALLDPAAFSRFSDALPKLGRRFPTTLDELRAFLGRWHNTGELRRRVIAGHRRALDSLAGLAAGREATDLLADIGPELTATVADLGFSLSDADALTVQRQARLAADAQQLIGELGIPLVRQRLANRLKVQDVATITPAMFFAELLETDGSRWFMDMMAEAGRELDLPEARVREVAAERLRWDRLERIATAVDSAASGEAFLGFSPRVLCLVAVSLLVCIVGIANAMLMSVMERFREIATMKCLGATDEFVMVNFILESCCQGIAGGAIGAVFGLGLGVLRAVSFCGWMAIRHVPGPELALSATVALVLGVLISALAAVYPASVAARLAPMEAMRVE